MLFPIENTNINIRIILSINVFLNLPIFELCPIINHRFDNCYAYAIS